MDTSNTTTKICHKRNNDPIEWLEKKLGKRKTRDKLTAIQTYLKQVH